VSDLGRFKNLEKRRAGTDDDAAAPADEPAHSKRFGKIEPRKTPEPGATGAAPDPFAPPPEETEALALEIREDDRREIAVQRAAHNKESEAGLHAALDIMAENKATEREAPGSIMRWLIDLTMRQRLSLVVGGTIVIGLLTIVFGRPLWGLEPILLVVALVGLLAKEA
jgi:hypothetical protein